MENQTSPPIDTSHMESYIGRRARLTGRLGEINPETKTAKMTVCDGEEVVIAYESEEQWARQTPCVEVLGTVINVRTIQMETLIPQGANLDMDTVWKTIKIIHDPRFKGVFFGGAAGAPSLPLGEDPRYQPRQESESDMDQDSGVSESQGPEKPEKPETPTSSQST
ncbi:hypothetical protein VNI00_016944 [Paramarasmius palmivorus]|uniref:Replication factor A protein 3 n=1 Tax=Paramarasmius palmivorus TaxID=297713 RepID=A0AAW0B9N6_9AGAR